MTAEEFEKEHVYDVYSKIANHFNKTRYHTWPKIKEFVDSLNKNSTIYDVGCGNGRNMNIRDDCNFIGCDNNHELLNEAKKNNHECYLGDNLNIPFSDNIADAVLSIAVIHHFSNIERRILALGEIFRILKVNGMALIYVWAHEQPKFATHSKNTMVDWNDQSTGKTYKRFYYLFTIRELDNLISNNFHNIEIIESGIQKDNYYVICKKHYK
tara:strand:- start:39713 stop:40348 length:636 start_codon:yes stop_codon:yes gene_type:complete